MSAVFGKLSMLNIKIGNVLGRVHRTILSNAIKVGYPFSSELDVVMKNKREERWGGATPIGAI